ncbi:MAG: YicC family protein [Deltaproteobacteria bacterium]|nr:YicC family protein [Deltaproteobacteria bacterium]
MTGFGRAEQSRGGWLCRVEVRSVNFRFLDPRLRLPPALAHLEEDLKAVVKKRLERGKVEITMHITPDLPATPDHGAGQPQANPFARLAQLARQAEQAGIPLRVSLREMMEFQEIAPGGGEDNQEALGALAEDTLGLALDQLTTMRRVEGQALKADLSARLALMRGLMEQIVPLARELPALYAQRLKDNLARLNPGLTVDPERVALEMALFADKCDVTEEITRFMAHLDHMEQLMEEQGSVGRKMDFLSQELNREINTLTTKGGHQDISRLGVELKSELEKLREQAQNIE